VAGTHDFFLLSRSEHPFSSYANFINDPRAVLLDDAIILYLMDSLEWIPSFAPHRGEPSTGLDHLGVTIIDTDGAPAARRIFSAWADLFSAGPPVLRLTERGTRIVGQPSDLAGIEPLQIDRDETVDRLRTLADYADRVANSKDDLYILHLGV